MPLIVARIVYFVLAALAAWGAWSFAEHFEEIWQMLMREVTIFLNLCYYFLETYAPDPTDPRMTPVLQTFKWLNKLVAFEILFWVLRSIIIVHLVIASYKIAYWIAKVTLEVGRKLLNLIPGLS